MGVHEVPRVDGKLNESLAVLHTTLLEGIVVAFRLRLHDHREIKERRMCLRVQDLPRKRHGEVGVRVVVLVCKCGEGEALDIRVAIYEGGPLVCREGSDESGETSKLDHR